MRFRVWGLGFRVVHALCLVRWFVGGYIGVDGVSQGLSCVNRCFLGVYSILLKAFNTQWAQWVQSTDIVGCRVSILGTTKIRFREVSP